MNEADATLSWLHRDRLQKTPISFAVSASILNKVQHAALTEPFA